MVPMLLGLASKLNTLLDRLSSLRAGYLDRLDATISSRASASVWTSALATKLDTLALVSKSDEITSGSGNWSVPTGVSLVWVSLIGGGGSGAVSVGSSTQDLGGGASGETLWRVPYKVTAGGTVTYAIGAGGAAVTRSTAGTTNGNTGSSTTWGTGTTQIRGRGGLGGTTTAGGAGQGEDTTASIAGRAGGFDAATPTNARGTASVGFIGGAGSGTSSAVAGGGAASPFGFGSDAASSTGSATASAGARGSGGGSAVTTGTGTATSGAGGDGYILIEWIG